jgi:uncharacterized membrane protein YqjE
MDPGAPGPSGLLGSLRGLADNFFGTVQDRVELLSVELQEEKQRLTQTFLWTTVFVFTAMLATMFVSIALLLVFWDTAARIPIAIALAALYTVAAVVLGFKVRRVLHQPRPLRATLEELENDRACLPPRK